MTKTTGCRGAAGEQPDQRCEQEQVADRVGTRDDLAEDGLPAVGCGRSDDEHAADHREPGTDDCGVEEGCTVPAAASPSDQPHQPDHQKRVPAQVEGVGH